MQNLLECPDGSIREGELYMVSGSTSRGSPHTGLAKAQRCSACRIGYDFVSPDNKHYLIGDLVTRVTLPFDENDIEYYEGSHPST